MEPDSPATVETTAQPAEAAISASERMKQVWAKRKEKAAAKAAKQMAQPGNPVAVILEKFSRIEGAIADLAKRVEGVEQVGTPSITVQTKDGKTIAIPGMASQQTSLAPTQEVVYPSPPVQGAPGYEKVYWILCANGHVGAWTHEVHPSAVEVFDLIASDKFHRYRPVAEDRRSLVRGELPLCTFCGSGLPTTAGSPEAKVYNFNAKYVRVGIPPAADAQGYPVR